MNAALILSGGAGARFGGEEPKQYALLRGKPVIEYVIAAAEAARAIDKIVIAAHESERLDALSRAHDFTRANAGDSRNRTLARGLDALCDMNCQNVVILDAVRPLVTGELIDEYVSFLKDYDAVATAQKITDSLGCYDIPRVDRERYFLMQSPEAFRFALLRANFDENSPLTEVTQQLPANSRVKLCFDFPNNPKITYKWDIASVAAALE